MTVGNRNNGQNNSNSPQRKIKKRIFFKMELSVELRAEDFTDSIKKAIKEKFLNNP